MNINLTTKKGIVLETKQTFCEEDITITPTLQTKTITPDTAEQIVTSDDGYCGLDSVTISSIQTESKTVTPTKAVQTIIPSTGKYLSQVAVNAIPNDYIIPSGTQDITENGSYDITEKATVNVNVPSVTDISTASEMRALLTAANVGKYYKYTGTTDSNYINGDIYLVEEKSVSSETWLLNETLTGNTDGQRAVNFTSNSAQYSKISYDGSELFYDVMQAYNIIDGWNNATYRTIVFDTAVTDESLLTWLTANGTKQ